jgi:hypothetical protein
MWLNGSGVNAQRNSIFTPPFHNGAGRSRL